MFLKKRGIDIKLDEAQINALLKSRTVVGVAN